MDGIIDANGEGLKGFEIGPGIRFDIPIFNRNQGGILRANAEVMQARYNRDAIRDQIVLDVRTAATQLRQAQDNLRDCPRPDFARASRGDHAVAERAFEGGGTSYLLVLQTTTDYVNAQIARTHADGGRTPGVCRARAERWPQTRNWSPIHGLSNCCRRRSSSTEPVPSPPLLEQRMNLAQLTWKATRRGRFAQPFSFADVARRRQRKRNRPPKWKLFPRETIIGRITLTPDAYRRLGITEAAVSQESVARHILIGGDTLIPQGKSIVVSAPCRERSPSTKGRRFHCPANGST